MNTKPLFSSLVLFAGAIALGLGGCSLRDFLEARYMAGGSMEPTLMTQDRVLINKVRYRSQAPRRGDIIIFEPTTLLKEQGLIDPFLKRIIGIPGDRVELKGGDVYINGTRLPEPYLAADTATSSDICAGSPTPAFLVKPVKVPPRQYLVLGDNRTNSYDSRCWGLIHRDDIIGQATTIYWPSDRAGDIPIPTYGDSAPKSQP
jgi:signal peptidase I